MKDKRKSILFLYQDEKLASSRVRVINLIDGLEKSGFECTALQYPKNFKDRVLLLLRVRKFDIVFLQKKLVGWFWIKALHLMARFLIFDFDDAIYIRQSGGKSLSRTLKFNSAVSTVDLVIAGNNYLAGHAGKFNAKIEVVPSSVPVTDIPQKKGINSDAIFVIGWIGGKGNFSYLELLKPALQKLSRHYEFQLRIVSDGVFEMDGVDVKNIQWSLAEQEAEIAKFDVGVMPLFDDVWSRGKCGYKALQYMAAGVVPVVSDVGANAEAIKHGENGFKASNADDFYLHIKTLIENREQAISMGERARKEVEANYSIDAVVKKLSNVFTKTISGRDS